MGRVVETQSPGANQFSKVPAIGSLLVSHLHRGPGIPSFNVDTSTPFEQTTTLDAYQHQQVSYTDAVGRDRYEQVFSGTASPYTVVRPCSTPATRSAM